MVILPQKNEKDLRDIPEEIRKQIKLVLVDSMDQVLEHALRRRPQAAQGAPAEVVERGDELAEEPERAGQGAPTASRRPTSRRPWLAASAGASG